MRSTTPRHATWLLLALAACSSVDVTKDVSYDDRDSVARLDIYDPPHTGALRPAVLVIHGGSWQEGAFGHRNVMAQHAQRLADAGYVAFNVEYRLTPNGGKFPHAVQDCLCALAWVQQHAADYDIDPDRIASFGYSAGGHLASMLGVVRDSPITAPDCASGTPLPVAAVVSGAGPQDMRLLAGAGAVTDFVGGTLAENPQAYLDASPISYVQAGDPPFLFIDGTEDLIVPIEHAKIMKAKLEAVGTETRLLAIPGGGHLIHRGPDAEAWEVAMAVDEPEAWAAVFDFLDHTIGEARP